MLEAVILAGGRGERFWPLSRRSRPKQLLRLLGERTLLRDTWERLTLELDASRICVIGAADLEEQVRRDLPGLHPERFIGEPLGRNTAPAIAVAAALGARAGRDPVQLIVPADHWISSGEEFWKSIRSAAGLAEAADAPLVTLGIPIARAEPGYGYIERGAPRQEAAGAYAVVRFHEKPDRETAAAYMRAQRFYWNSGIFVWRARALLAEIATHMPALHRLVAPLVDASDPWPLLPGVFAKADAQSIDFGLLERSSKIVVVEAQFAWSDLGNWMSWSEHNASDESGNASRGDVLTLDSSGNLLYCDQGLIAALGVRNLAIIRTGDVTLVVDKERCQEVRRILEALRKKREFEKYL
ncbi:MAG: mannose-1-phosphate guanylyltransferase [Candidatus Eisenbacteria bacterium]|nr:mannose-1-phosphate guanylyltransferase [Candidatus Eisenbacteria bacterium]